MVHVSKRHFVFNYQGRRVRLSTRMYQILCSIYGNEYIPTQEIVKSIYGVEKPKGVQTKDHPQTQNTLVLIRNLRKRLGHSVVESSTGNGYRTSKKFNKEVKLEDIIEEGIDSPKESKKERTSHITKVSLNSQFIEVKKIVSKETVENWISEGVDYLEMISRLKNLKLSRSNLRIYEKEDFINWNLSTFYRFLEYMKLRKKGEDKLSVYCRFHYKKYKGVVNKILKNNKTYLDVYRELDKNKVPLVQTGVVERINNRSNITKWVDIIGLSKSGLRRGSSNSKLQKYIKVNHLSWKPLVSKNYGHMTDDEKLKVKRFKEKKIKEHYKENKEVIDRLLETETTYIKMSLKMDELKVPLLMGKIGLFQSQSKGWTTKYSHTYKKTGKTYYHYSSKPLLKYLDILGLKTKDGFLPQKGRTGKGKRDY